MPVSLVELFVAPTNVKPATPALDVTAQALAGTPITYNIGTPYAQRYFWVRIVDDSGNEKVTELGSYRTQDNTPPVLDLSLALGSPTVSVINATFSVTDASGQVAETWVHIGTAAGATPSQVRATGVQKTVGATSHSFTGLNYNTQYFVTLLAKDAAGNEAITTVDIATAPDTTAPNLDSYVLRAPTGAEGNPELVVMVELVVSDVVA